MKLSPAPRLWRRYTTLETNRIVLLAQAGCTRRRPQHRAGLMTVGTRDETTTYSKSNIVVVIIGSVVVAVTGA